MLGLFFWQKYKSFILARGPDYRGSTWPSLLPFCTKVQSHFFFLSLTTFWATSYLLKITLPSHHFPVLFLAYSTAGVFIALTNYRLVLSLQRHSYWEAYWENTSHPIIGLFLLDTISVGNFHMWGSLTNSIWGLFDKDYPRPCRHSWTSPSWSQWLACNGPFLPVKVHSLVSFQPLYEVHMQEVSPCISVTFHI